MIVEEFALTTVDNPYNPLVDFKSWLTFDMDHGYETHRYLDLVSLESESLTDEENIIIRNQAIDDIIESDPFGLYKKVRESDKVIPITFTFGIK